MEPKNKEAKTALEKILVQRGIKIGETKFPPYGSQTISVEEILSDGDFALGLVSNYAHSSGSGYPSSNYSIILANLGDGSACHVMGCSSHGNGYRVPTLKELKVEDIITVTVDFRDQWGRGEITDTLDRQFVYASGNFGEINPCKLVKDYGELDFYP